MLKKRNQKGFTLIEIIAVLVILGILAAVAIPKYLNMADDARNKALDGAVAALISSAAMDYSKGFLEPTVRSTATGWTPTTSIGTGNIVGDFSGNITAVGSGVYTATVTSAPDGYSSAVMSGSAKTFKLY